MPETPEYVLEPAKKVPVKHQVDVLVLGGGPAGAAAAISAARQGARTLLLEQFGTIGGMATTGLMSHWGGRTDGGFFEDFMDRVIDDFTTGAPGPASGGNWLAINTEKQKTVFLEMLAEVGAKFQLYTLACAPILDGQKITGVIAESKSGREAFLARVVIDATGDGDIAARAGVPFTKGRESDGKMQPMTLMFRVAGVDVARGVFPGAFEQSFPVPKGDLQTLGKTHLPPPAGHVLLYRSPLPGVVTVNMTNCIDVDGTRAEDLTRAEIVCRSQIDPIVRFLREFIPGFEKCYAISSGAVVGVRETRHFEGEYTLTPEDILQARVFDDWAVARVHFNFDVHNLAGSGLDETGVQKKFPQQKPYTIPYRCFVPKKVDNLLLAGRNISGTHLAHSSFRIMPICANGGQAVGIAASLCVKQNILPRQLNVKQLQDILKTQGVTP